MQLASSQQSRLSDSDLGRDHAASPGAAASGVRRLLLGSIIRRLFESPQPWYSRTELYRALARFRLTTDEYVNNPESALT